MSLKQKLSWILLICVLYVILTTCTIATYAYFSKKDIYDGYLSGQVELLFDRLNSDGLTDYGKAEGITASADAEWGTKEYPYVISNVRHLYNLSELQRLGYFKKRFLDNQTAENPYSNIPYFLVCTPEYKPTTIDGSKFKNITAIGTDQYPFIGSVKGVTNTAAPTTIPDGTDNGKSCDTSAIYNVTVAGNPANVDVGLFGVIGFLGTEPTPNPNSTDVQTFEGQVSTVSNLVLSDVQVVVKSSAWDKVISFVEDIMVNATAGHRYSFSELYGDTEGNYDKVPHENHHIGILAGHASYANIEFISVYYSNDNVVAMDLTDETVVSGKNANYLSATGILGFINNINPRFADDGKIEAGTGDSIGDISYGAVGGGGVASGTKAGYVLASEMYNKYHHTSAGEDTTGTVILRDVMDENGKPLCVEWIRDRIGGFMDPEHTGRYYFYDGVFTFSLSDTKEDATAGDVIEPTWENDTPTQFSIGQDDPTKWKATPASSDDRAVVAYVKKVTSDADLQAAISNHKQIFIMQENQANLFLMSLFSQSTPGSGNFEQKYTTPGTRQQFDPELAQTLANAYLNNEIVELPSDITNDYKVYKENGDLDLEESIKKLANELKDNKLQAINVGNTTTITLEQLTSQYKITPQATGKYSYFVGNTPVVVNTDGTIQQYFDYAKSSYTGYFYYTLEQKSATERAYTYYWQPKDGDAFQIGTATANWFFGWFGENLPEDFFATAGEDWQGEAVYTHTYNETEYKGVVVYKSDGTFFNSGNKADANGATLTKPTTGDSVYYFYHDISATDGAYHYWSDQDGTGTKYYLTGNNNKLTETNEESLSGMPIYSTSDNKKGVLLDRYPTYTFSNGENFLWMIGAKFNYALGISFGSHYVLWNGTEAAAGTASNFNHNFAGTNTPSEISKSAEATLRFATDGTCYIQYSIGSVGLYVNSTGSVFNTATTNTDSGTKLCIYTVEGTHDIIFEGRISFEPIDDKTSTTDQYSFSAGEYVLKATHPTDEDGVVTDPATTLYTVTSLEELNWNNGSNETLSQADLLKKFRMNKGINFALKINAFGGSLGTGGFITAPVGTNGVNANIPQACIAFRINKTMEAAKIRVIVSVAASEFFPGETDNNGNPLYNLGDYTRYFNIWHMDEAGNSWLQVFQADDYLDRFAIPRSHPYNHTTLIADAEYITVRYRKDTNSEYQNYRCYLNGDRVLVAYEFVVNTNATGIGIYCLGMSGHLDGNQCDVPMEIVYFSADGVASSGRDGATGSQIGTIDFVYDYGEGANAKIVTVTESSSTDTAGNEDYSTYYPSYCLLYFNTTEHATGYTEENPTYLPVNNEKVVIRRYVIGTDSTPSSDANHNKTPSRSTLTYKLTGGDGRVKVSQYSRVADNVIQQGTSS